MYEILNSGVIYGIIVLRRNSIRRCDFLEIVFYALLVIRYSPSWTQARLINQRRATVVPVPCSTANAVVPESWLELNYWFNVDVAPLSC